MGGSNRGNLEAYFKGFENFSISLLSRPFPLIVRYNCWLCRLSIVSLRKWLKSILSYIWNKSEKHQGLSHSDEYIYSLLTYRSPSILLLWIERKLPPWILHLGWFPEGVRPFTRVSNVRQDNLLMSRIYFQLSNNLSYDHNKLILF